MEHPLHYAIDYDLNVIKLGYFDGDLEDARWLARGYAISKNMKYYLVVNHAELITLYNNIDAATSDSLAGQPFA